MSNRTLTPEDARRFVVESSDVELWHIGHALDRAGTSLVEDVPVELIADMLEVGEPENWERTTRETATKGQLFHPYCVVPKEDGKRYRSWLPEDLDAKDEAPIRALATSSKNPFVKARLFEILWARFGTFSDAAAAMDARFACAPLMSVEDGWPRLVKNLGRLTTLVISLNQGTRLAALVTALDEAAVSLINSSRPFSFPVLADMVCNTLLIKPSGRAAFTTTRSKSWDEWLSRVATLNAGDAHHGHDALMILQAWRGRLGDTEGSLAAKRQVVANLRMASKAGSSLVATSLAQRALQAALDFGLTGETTSLRAELMSAIKGAIPNFKQISGTLTIPKELFTTVEVLIASSPRLAGAIRQLAVLPGLLEVDLEGLRETAREQLRESSFLSIIPTEHYHPDGKVTFRSNDFEGNVERHVAFLIGGHLVVVEALLRYFLTNAASRLERTTMVEALARWPHLPPHREVLLATGAERFAAGDMISCGLIVLTVYEAVLRDLLRALGHPALKVERGVQMDETLNSLLRGEPARKVLGAAHCKLAEYVLCDPELGWNLRNEVAHGTVRPDALSPSRVFLSWLLLIRLTCFSAAPDEQAAPSPTAGETAQSDQVRGSAPENPAGAPTPEAEGSRTVDPLA